MRLSATGLACFLEDLALDGLECVLHDGTFHRREFAADRDCPVFRRADVEVTQLPEPGVPQFSFFLGALGGDDTLALLAQLVEGVFPRRLDQPRRRIWIRFNGRKE
jgi:hypothetical protein